MHNFSVLKILYIYTYVLCSCVNNFHVSLNECVTHQGLDFILYHGQRRPYVMIQLILG